MGGGAVRPIEAQYEPAHAGENYGVHHLVLSDA